VQRTEIFVEKVISFENRPRQKIEQSFNFFSDEKSGLLKYEFV